MEAFLQDILWSFVLALAFLSIVFCYGNYRKRYDIIDSAWGPTFIVIALSLLVLEGNLQTTSVLLLLMVSAWSLRLYHHIYTRFRKSDAEDPRYIELRKKWPKQYIPLQVYLRIYLVQALLATVVSLPVILVVGGTVSPLVTFASLGVAVWLAGFLIEIISDAQLKIFLSIPENRGKIMQDGLWAYSRHPNYFGEILLWWGIGIMTYGTPYALIGFIGPLAITLLIVFVSGIPPAEKRASSKPGWKAYAKKTNVLIPWPPVED